MEGLLNKGISLNGIVRKLLESDGELVKENKKKKAKLYKYNNIEYVLLQDGGVITRHEDNMFEPFFPYPSNC